MTHKSATQNTRRPSETLKNKDNQPTATLLVCCRDEPGLVVKFANFIHSHGGNIIHSDNHADLETGLFLTRLEWRFAWPFRLTREEISEIFRNEIAPPQSTWRVSFSDSPKRVAIWVSHQDHCLYDLLLRHKAGELPAEIAFVLGNHQSLEGAAQQLGALFYHVPLQKDDNKAAAEKLQLELVQRHNVDLIVLAKYMQILSPSLLEKLPPVINIHHSFLPAFSGARPYHRAYERGVKVIGATAHYVTSELDQGPIIEQNVVRVNHTDTVQDMIREGRDIERTVLARAVRLHLMDRVLVYGNRTVVFD